MTNTDSLGFINFLKENNVIVTVIATIVSTRISELSESLIDDLIMPILNRDADGDGNADINDLATYEYKISGINLKIGKFFVVVLKFLIILYITYQVSKILKNNKI